MLPVLDDVEFHNSLRGFDIANRNGIVMLTIPPHTSHQLNPLDKNVYGPFKTYYNRALDGWMTKKANICQFPGCVNEAFMLAIPPQNNKIRVYSITEESDFPIHLHPNTGATIAFVENFGPNKGTARFLKILENSSQIVRGF